MSDRQERLKPFLARIAAGESLSEAEAGEAFDIIMSGEATPAQIGSFLMGLRIRGETVEEITGAARAMRAKATMIDAPPGAIDCCGTGGDGAGTLNISTAVSFVLAGAGVPVAKHGNRAQSSRSGAADVLAALGVNLDAGLVQVRTALWQVGICFLLAPRHHSAMRHVAPTRVELGTRTVFNLLGPLVNPAGVRRQLVGVFDGRWLEPLAEVFGRLGSERAWVVHGADGLDEISTTGPTQIAEWHDGAIRRFEIRPEDMGLERVALPALAGGDAPGNAEMLLALLRGAPGPYRDITLANAAAALVVAGHATDLAQGMGSAAASIDDGRALAALERLVEVTNRADELLQEEGHG